MAGPRIDPQVEQAIRAVVERDFSRGPRVSGRCSYARLSEWLRDQGLECPSFRTFTRCRAAILLELSLLATEAGSGSATSAGSSPRSRPRTRVGARPTGGPVVPASRAGHAAAPETVPGEMTYAVHHVPLDLHVTSPNGGRLSRPLLTVIASARVEGEGPPQIRIAWELTLPRGGEEPFARQDA